MDLVKMTCSGQVIESETPRGMLYSGKLLQRSLL